MKLHHILPVCLLALSACSQGTAPPEGKTAPAGPASTDERLSTPASAENGQKLFLACAVCHDVKEGVGHRVGPNLFGIYEAPAARFDDFAYSQALLNSDLTWDEATLDAYLERPIAVVPRGRMAYAGEPNAANRRDVIAYLKTLK
ncbi:cytochrome c family protein [Parvularcula sp. IMCC14364]|uniref:c-type cytochrome n=1 Tax=Parvularcula sp. IMCC14364 TaxID=3067902 RepID=UPI0027417C7F|nr:c-type cytochrome [Parvularcula sp. IMCC14364]